MKSWGGSRKGSGRKPKDTKKRKVSVTLDQVLIDRIDALAENRSVTIENAVRIYLSRGHDKDMKEYGFDPAGLLEQAKGNALINIIERLEPRARSSAPVSIPELWYESELSGWNRQDFEATLFHLAESYRIFLHRHVHEIQASEEMKNASLRGKDGSLYIGLVLKAHGKMQNDGEFSNHTIDL